MRLLGNGPCERVYGRTVYGLNRIGGRGLEAATGKRFERRNPANSDDLVGTFPLSGEEDVAAACEAAREAFWAWARTPAPVRAGLFANAARILSERKDPLARMATREVGKPLREAEGSVQEAIDTCQFFLSEGRRLYGQTVPSEMPRKDLFTFRRPIGVVGVITAGNFPIAVPSWKIVPALLCGNTVVWKPSEDAPATALLFAVALEAAGAPPGTVNVVFGTGAGGAGEAVVRQADAGGVQKISFTGSTAVGRRIGEACGRNLQIPTLELGGKNPLVVMDDADLDLAVEGAIWASFGTGGQRCTSAGNLILHRGIAREFTRRFLAKARRLVVGDPTIERDVSYGPMISGRFAERFEAHLGWGPKDGARLLLGGRRIAGRRRPRSFAGDPDKGRFYEPTVWGGVRPGMRLAREEVFGPTINLISVRDLGEAIAAANASPYGLSSAIYTRDLGMALRFKDEVEAGMTSVNNSTTGAEAHLPFGGTKASGNGTRESGIWVLEGYTRWQAVNVDLSGRLQLAQMDTAEVRARGDARELDEIAPRRVRR